VTQFKTEEERRGEERRGEEKSQDTQIHFGISTELKIKQILHNKI